MNALRETLPSEWLPGLEALRALPDGGIALLVGPTDRGKTTFTTLAARILASEGGRVAVIDSDIGQSEIGPPGTVGVAWANAATERLSDLKPAAQFFVGAFAPPAVALELVTATVQAVHWAKTNGAQRLVIDTTGFVTGAAARRLKSAKAQAVSPSLLLGFGDTITPLLTTMAAASGAKTVLCLETPAAVGRKPTALRTTRRLTRLSKALDGARRFALPLTETATVGALLGAGTPLTPELTRWTGTALRLPVVHAEQSDGILTVFLSGNGTTRPNWEQDAGAVAQHFGCRTVRAVSLSAYNDTLIGLSDRQGRLLSIGRWEGLDTERGEALVSAPPPATLERVKLLQFGRVRVEADGTFRSEIRPGEI